MHKKKKKKKQGQIHYFITTNNNKKKNRKERNSKERLGGDGDDDVTVACSVLWVWCKESLALSSLGQNNDVLLHSQRLPLPFLLLHPLQKKKLMMLQSPTHQEGR